MKQYITIPGQTRSKKNNMQILRKWAKGRRMRAFIAPSNRYEIWRQKAKNWIRKQQYPAWDGDYPLEIHFFLFRDSYRLWDIDNVFCGTLDVLQETKIIENDTAKHVIPVFAGWAIDRTNPRVELKLCKPKKLYFREDLCKNK